MSEYTLKPLATTAPSIKLVVGEHSLFIDQEGFLLFKEGHTLAKIPWGGNVEFTSGYSPEGVAETFWECFSLLFKEYEPLFKETYVVQRGVLRMQALRIVRLESELAKTKARECRCHG